MRRSLLLLSGLTLLLVLAACASEPAATETTEADAVAAAPDASGDPLSGTWTGDWGPTETHRNPVTLDLKWDGSALTGTVNPAGEAIPLTKATYAADTGMVMMEAEAKGHNGEMVHYMIEGKVEGSSMMGTWSHGDSKGDFKLSK